MNNYFIKAKPVWAAGLSDSPNCYMTFRADAESLDGTTLFLTGATSYRVFVNGIFVHYGPARTAKGYARVDELPLSAYSLPGGNEVVINISGYRCFSLATVNQPSFLCAELQGSNGEIIAATGNGQGFSATLPGTRVQKVMRYSRQRHFSEVWDFTGEENLTPCVTEERHGALSFLPRHAPLPEYREVFQSVCSVAGEYTETVPGSVKRAPYKDDEILGEWGGFPYDEIIYTPFDYIQRCDIPMRGNSSELPLELSAYHYAVFDLKTVHSGFIRCMLDCRENTDLIVAFTEYSDSDSFVIPRVTSVNVLEYLLENGRSYNLVSAEPYTFRYIIVLVKSGSVTLNTVGAVSMGYPSEEMTAVAFDDPKLSLIWNAAKRSFIHNAVDIYTDCPSRERAGWLCDSYFTAKAEYYFTGKALVEDDFLENFLLRPDDEPNVHSKDYPYGRSVPRGMLPMCYPADITGSRFIPQWAMWFVLEADEYLRLRRPDADRSGFCRVVKALTEYFAAFENSDGLLESLDGWNFVEWSKANQWTMDVSYPTNFLYAETVEAAGRILGNADEAGEKADRIRKKTVELSFNGEFFTDNAKRGEDGILHNTGNTTETCQYYALRFGKIDLDLPQYRVLKNAVYNVFGPGRTDEYPDIVKSNSFIGMYVRMEALLRLGLYGLLLDNIKGYFGYMAEATGTLWEYSEQKGSLDHGFASYAAYCIAQADNKITHVY